MNPKISTGSHDIASNRDMRDALGALGNAYGNGNPELSNLTLSMTIVDKGDIIYLTSDGITDNFDPVVGKFADIFSNEPGNILKPNANKPRHNNQNVNSNRKNEKSRVPVVTSMKKDSDSLEKVEVPTQMNKRGLEAPSNNTKGVKSNKPVYLRSKTLIEPRRVRTTVMSPEIRILKSSAGLPLVTGPQRHALTLLRMEDLFLHGINGSLHPCNSAKKLCYLLIDFSRMITLARRKMLEQRELFYKCAFDVDGKKKEVEMTRNHHRAARKRVVESSTFKMLPGKLDHASCVAFKVGVYYDTTLKTLSINKSYTETDF